MLFLSFTLQAYEGLRLAQLGLETAATGLMLDACRGTSMCNTTHCMGIDDLTYGGTSLFENLWVPLGFRSRSECVESCLLQGKESMTLKIGEHCI